MRAENFCHECGQKRSIPPEEINGFSLDDLKALADQCWIEQQKAFNMGQTATERAEEYLNTGNFPKEYQSLDDAISQQSNRSRTCFTTAKAWHGKAQLLDWAVERISESVK